MSELPERARSVELGIDEEALSTLFAYAAQKYVSPAKKQPLRGVALDVFKVLVREAHTTLQEIGDQHGREALGSKSDATVTKAISRLEERGVPVQREQVDDPYSTQGTKYTRYFMKAADKMALLEEAVTHKAQLDSSTLGVDEGAPAAER